MKTDREELKEIVKECLLEILSEGLGKRSKKQEIRESKTASRPTRESLLAAENARIEAHRKALDEKKIEKNPAIRAFKGNSVMQDILADTAQTTLLEQAAYEKRGAPISSDRASKVVAETEDIADIFGDRASMWETLAFSSKK